MSSSNEKYLGESLLKDIPGKKLSLKIGDKTIRRKHLSDEVLWLYDKVNDLQNQVSSMSPTGAALSNEFGDNSLIGVSQKTLTEAINEIWYKLEDITGETLIGVNLTVSPEYYVGEEGCLVHLDAETVSEHGILETVKFLVNGEEVISSGGVHEFEYDVLITDTSVIKCEAKILGVVYERSVTITHYSPFWVGAGTSYSSVMTMSNIRSAANGMKGNYSIPFTAGQRLFVIVEDILRDRFVRADMNGVEIQFTETTQTISGKTYYILTSENTYQAGTYNIDINS